MCFVPPPAPWQSRRKRRLYRGLVSQSVSQSVVPAIFWDQIRSNPVFLFCDTYTSFLPHTFVALPLCTVFSRSFPKHTSTNTRACYRSVTALCLPCLQSTDRTCLWNTPTGRSCLVKFMVVPSSDGSRSCLVIELRRAFLLHQSRLPS